MTREAEAIAGRGRAELLGIPACEAFAAAEGEPFRAACERARAEGQASHLEEAYYPPLGRCYEVSVYPASPGVAVFIRDVTERRRAREELAQAAALRERLVAIVGHDLRNPLSAIQMTVSSLLQRSGLGETDLRRLERVRSTSRRMASLIEQLLDYVYGGLDSGMSITPGLADLGEICARIIEELAVAHPEATVRLEACGDLSGVWDPDRLEQLVQNLVGNAIQHGDAAGALVRASGDEDAVRLAVYNRGEPIPADLMPHLFEPFRRAAAGGRRRAEGLGLGLYIVRQIVEGHGGTIEVRSTAQDGTTIEVRLPRRPAERGAPA